MRAFMVIGLAAALAVGASAQQPAELQVGDPAPDFELRASDGKTYKLSDFRGKQAVVVAWFPRAFTQGCTVECRSLAQNGANIRKFNVTYFMASVDPLDENTRFAESLSADFPLLSDPDRAVATRYGVLSQRGFANRWTFYIDKQGRVAHIDKQVRPDTSAEDMIATLGRLNVEAVR